MNCLHRNTEATAVPAFYSVRSQILTASERPQSTVSLAIGPEVSAWKRNIPAVLNFLRLLDFLLDFWYLSRHRAKVCASLVVQAVNNVGPVCTFNMDFLRMPLALPRAAPLWPPEREPIGQGALSPAFTLKSEYCGAPLMIPRHVR